MSELLKKSLINLKSADLLSKKQIFYSSSIHCSYYCCLQIIIHLLTNTEFAKDFKKFKDAASKKAKEDKNEDELGLHNLYINFIKIKLLKLNFEDASEFIRKMESLKAARVDSDYKEIEISKVRASDALERANRVKKILDKVFELEYKL